MYSVIHDLSFFVKDGDVYERYDETHEQRTFPFETYAAFLESAGFEQIEVTADFTNEAPQRIRRKIFYFSEETKNHRLMDDGFFKTLFSLVAEHV